MSGGGEESIDPTRFGYSNDEWVQAVDAGVAIMIGVVRNHTTIEYGQLCDQVFDVTGIQIVPGEYALPHFIGDISRSTLRTDGIAISALITYAGSVETGQGLYTLTINEGLLPANPTQDQKDRFRHEHMERSWDQWRRQRPRPGERYRGGA
jgi:hypothetical protein